MEVNNMEGRELLIKSLADVNHASSPQAHAKEPKSDKIANREKSNAQEEQVQQSARVPTQNRSGVRIHIDNASKRIVAQIVDKNDQVIKQIPSDEVLKLAEKARTTQGLIFDKKI